MWTESFFGKVLDHWSVGREYIFGTTTYFRKVSRYLYQWQRPLALLHKDKNIIHIGVLLFMLMKWYFLYLLHKKEIFDMASLSLRQGWKKIRIQIKQALLECKESITRAILWMYSKIMIKNQLNMWVTPE